MGVGSGGQGGRAIHDTDIVDRDLIVFFRSFFRFPLPERGLIVLFFSLFCYFSVFFPLLPLPSGNFSADAFVYPDA